MTSAPIARSLTRATSCFTTLKLTSASSSARRTSRSASVDVLFGQAAPRSQLIENGIQLGLQTLEHRPSNALAYGPARGPAHRSHVRHYHRILREIALFVKSVL